MVATKPQPRRRMKLRTVKRGGRVYTIYVIPPKPKAKG
jgi:hypothetical protein